jgi:hypothetical protein
MHVDSPMPQRERPPGSSEEPEAYFTWDLLADRSMGRAYVFSTSLSMVFLSCTLYSFLSLNSLVQCFGYMADFDDGVISPTYFLPKSRNIY